MADYYTIATITETPAFSSTNRSLALESSGRLWVAYTKTVATYLQVHCAYSDDGGKSWTEEQITTASEEHYFPVMAIDSNNDLSLVFSAQGRGAYTSRYSLLYIKRASGSWGSEEEVALKNVASPGQTQPSIAVDSADNVHVAWYGSGWSPNTGIYSVNYRKRTSGSWGAVETIANETTRQRGVQIAIDDSDNVHAVWGGKGWGANPTIYNIQYRKRTTSWQTQEAITDTDSNQSLPSIALDSSNDIHVAWAIGSVSIQYRKRTTSWQTQETITNGSEAGNLAYISIALDRGNVIQAVYTYGSYSGYLRYRRKTTAWSDAIDVYVGDLIMTPSLLWAKHPTISGVRTNVPDKAYIIWEEEASKVLFGIPLPAPSGGDKTIAEPIVVLEAIRNIEFVYGGRAYVDKSGNFVYESRYHRNV